MIVSCSNCNSKYSVDDSKIIGKKFGFNCPKCGTSVEFDNRDRKTEIKKTEDIAQEFPSSDELESALSNFASDTSDEGSLNIQDMDLPDLENLGEISEEGETASDAVNISGMKDMMDMSQDELVDASDLMSKEEIPDNLLDELDEEVLKESDSADILSDFSPIEEDISIEKGRDSELSFGEDIVKSDFDEDDILISDVKSDELFSGKSSDDDEDITIDLDSLDIQLEEEDESSTGKGMEVEEISDTIEPLSTESLEISDIESGDIPAKKEKKTPDEDEDITLDLDSLDLTLDEVEELKEGEEIDVDEERISLSDAGLTTDELIEEEIIPGSGTEDEDIRLNIDEVAPEVGIEEGSDLSLRKDFKKHDSDIDSTDADIRDTVPRGMINFSIDYSLRFSRIGAFFRLICIFPIIMIPHFIVLALYSVLSFILSFFNWIIILLTGTHEEDFIEIQLNTLRYFLSIDACCIGMVEERPIFAGRKDIDYPLQFDATYPIRYSRILSFLRLSIIGILICALPHIILLFILSIGSMLICFIGLLSVIFRKKWPKILFDFMVRFYRYSANVFSYIIGVIDRYPSFKFE